MKNGALYIRIRMIYAYRLFIRKLKWTKIKKCLIFEKVIDLYDCFPCKNYEKSLLMHTLRGSFRLYLKIDFVIIQAYPEGSILSFLKQEESIMLQI